MTAVSVGLAPPARRWRASVRRARRSHHRRSLGDVLTDLYMLLWLVVVYGGVLAASIQRHLQSPSGLLAASAERSWIGVAVLLAGAGLAWQGARAVGPLLATPAELAWGVSTPLDRRGWLLPRFLWILLGSGVAAALVAMAVALLGLHSRALGSAALGGALWGLAGAAWCVTAQGVADRRRWPRVAGEVLTGLGVVIAALVVAAHYDGWQVLRPLVPAAAPLVTVGAVLAALALVRAVRTLPRIDAVRLGAGAPVAAAAATAAIGLDISLLSGVLEQRRWRSLREVHGRPFRAIMAGRTSALLQADLRRQPRRAAALGAWGALALAQYAVAVVAPSAAGIVHVIAAYLATNRLTGGLRSLARSPGLRRAIGGEEVRVRLTHLVVPGIGLAAWWALTWPAGGAHVGGLDLLLIPVVLAASYRASTRPPMTYGGALVETPVGLFPVDLFTQLVRGPDLLAVAILIYAIAAR